MESDFDKHLCLQCGNTIFGLDNYVTHRQEKCDKISQTVESPLLSEGCDILTSVDSTAKEELQETSFSTTDIDKLSADDFFLSLNLQSIANIGNGNHRSLSSVSDSFCSKLCFPSLDNDLDSSFSVDKEFLSETIINDSGSVDNLVESSLTNDCHNNADVNLSDKSLSEKIAKRRKLRSCLQNVRTSVRQAINKNTKALCCEQISKPLACPYCKFSCIFSSTLLKHFSSCETKIADVSKQYLTLKYEEMFAKNSQFNCNLCFFNCNDNMVFLQHLKHTTHCQKAATVKYPLICLPCDVEFSGSDDMKSHFNKYHIQNHDDLHPITISEMKRSLHCCFCLEITQGCHYILSNIDPNFNLPSEDIKLIKNSIKVVSQCAYNVEKFLLSSYLSVFNSLSNIVDGDINVGNNFDYESLKNEENLKSSALTKEWTGSIMQVKKDKLKQKQVIHKTNNLSGLECETDNLSSAFTKQIPHENIRKPTKNKKPYLCEVCGYSTKIFHHLTKHRRYHTGERPFQCKECNISFAVCSQLLRHTRLHTGAKPYKCPYCSYISNTQENLRKHVLKTKKHAGKKMYPCKYCKFECNDFSDYRYHLLEEHSDHFPDNRSISSSAVAGLYDIS